MYLTPLGRPAGSVPVAGTLLKAGCFGKQAPATVAAASVTPACTDSSDDIHRLLENYARQISQTEGQIEAIRQSQQQIEQEHALHLQDLRAAKAEAQHAEEENATLNAEVHQLQMEINAKQADCTRIKTKLAKSVESRTAVSDAISRDRCHFVSECQELDKQLRSLMAPRQF